MLSSYIFLGGEERDWAKGGCIVKMSQLKIKANCFLFQKAKYA